MLVITLLLAAELLRNEFDVDYSISNMLIRTNSMQEGFNENVMLFNKLACVTSRLKQALAKSFDTVFC